MVSKKIEASFEPIAQYANHIGWSDAEPYEIISRTAKTLTLRRMKAELDPEWKPRTVIGGFSGICTNQSEQKWIITSDPEGMVIKAHLRKEGRNFRFYSRLGRHSLSTAPYKFYDYNF